MEKIISTEDIDGIHFGWFDDDHIYNEVIKQAIDRVVLEFNLTVCGEIGRMAICQTGDKYIDFEDSFTWSAPDAIKLFEYKLRECACVNGTLFWRVKPALRYIQLYRPASFTVDGHCTSKDLIPVMSYGIRARFFIGKE